MMQQTGAQNGRVLQRVIPGFPTGFYCADIVLVFVRTVPHAVDGRIEIIVAGQVCRDCVAGVKLNAASKTSDCTNK